MSDKKEIKWSAAQEAAFSTPGSLIVSASAGSGKTTVMIERVCRLISQGVSVSSMVICTFTKAAAADIRQKLYTKLLALSGTNPNMIAELEKLPSAEISTLHSFCQRLIRAHFYAAETDPSYEVLDPTESEPLLGECIEAAIGEAIDESSLMLKTVMSSQRKTRPLFKAVSELYNYAAARPDSEVWLKGGEIDLLEDGKKVAEELQKEFGRRTEKLDEKLAKSAQDAAKAGFVKLSAVAEQTRDYLTGYADTLPRMPPRPRDANAAYIDLNDEISALKTKAKDLVFEMREVEQMPHGAVTKELVGALCAITLAAAEKYAAEKKSRNALDFPDLEQRALKVLQNADAAIEISQKYKYIFVDEYQDINPLQEKLVDKLSAESELFLVGDVKQSIYGFRQCDPKFFAQKLKSWNGEGRSVFLNENYRSNPRILEYCNDVMDRLMTEDFGGTDYKGTARLTAGANNAAGEKVIFKTICAKSEKRVPEGVYSVKKHAFSTAEQVSAEGAAVASYVTELLQGTIVDGGETRPVRPSDIAILVRSAGKNAQKIALALKGAGIEVSVGKNDDRADEAVRPLKNLLRLCDNAKDDIALIGVMRSTVGGFSDVDLSKIRLAAPPKTPFYAAAKKFSGDFDLRARLDAFFATVDRYQKLSLAKSPAELADQIVSECKLFEYAYSLPGGEARAAGLAAFLTGFASLSRDRTLLEAATLMDRVVAEGGETGGDAVRLMTVHQSKGLEFPFVIFPDTAKQLNFKDCSASLILDPDFGIAMKHYDTDLHKCVPTKLWKLCSMRKKRAQLEEEMRVLYVALTRAKKSLAIFAEVKEVKEDEADLERENVRTLYDWLRCPLDRADRYFVTKEEEIAEWEEETLTARTVLPDEDLAAEIGRRLDFSYPPAAMLAKTNVTKMADALYEAEPAAYFPSGLNESALDAGNAYHLFMQKIDFSQPFEKEWERLKENKQIDFSLIDRQKIETAATTVRGIIAGDPFYREKSFIMDVSDEKSTLFPNAALVQGVIDLLVVRGDSAVIVDYKNTRSQNPVTPAYTLQLFLYALAVKKLLGIERVDAYLYSFYSGKTFEVGVDN